MSKPLVPVIVLGGANNALCVARCLARHGVEVFAINYPGEAVRFTRYAKYIRLPNGSSPHAWRSFLLGADSDHLRGAVLLACSDEAISLIVENHAALSTKFLLEECAPAVRRDLLDKFTTYQRAREAGVPTVGFWLVNSSGDLKSAMAEFRFPLIMKPLYSPHSHVLGSKALLIADQAMLERNVAKAIELKVPIVLMEFIPGGDDKSCSYYTYMDENGAPLINFTKMILRRYPVNQGPATYHITKWIPEVAELGRRFFQHVGLRGVGHIEFKRDPRDGRLKIIESNARFTAADPILVRSGINLAVFTYNHLTRRPQQAPVSYRTGLIMWHPPEDFLAFLQLRRRKEITSRVWISTVVRARILPYFEWRDPVPSICMIVLKSIKFVRLLAGRGTRT